MEVSIKDDVIRAALARAADAIACLPEYQQEVSNREDMLAMLRGEDTGRDSRIKLQALAYAVVDGLPVDQRMVRLLRDMARRNPALVAEIACSVKARTGRAPDLGPEANALVERMWQGRVRHDVIEAGKATFH